MIAEAFLVCAMSAPSVAFTYGNTRLVQDEINFSHFLKAERNILVVGGKTDVVEIMNEHGLNAFGALTEDRDDVTNRYAVADPGYLPFLPESFNQIYWSHYRTDFLTDTYPWFLDAIRMLSPGGFFFVDTFDYIEWERWLYGRGFERLPFRLAQYAIFKKPTTGDHHLPHRIRNHEALKNRGVHEQQFKPEYKAILTAA